MHSAGFKQYFVLGPGARLTPAIPALGEGSTRNWYGTERPSHKKEKYLGLSMVVTPVIPAGTERQTGGPWLKARLGKTLERPHLKSKPGVVGAFCNPSTGRQR